MNRWIAAAALAVLLGGTLRADEWGNNFERARAQAVEEKKPMLLDFTGSDWCGWCMKFDKEVFETSEFKAYAKANLVLVRLDYPQQKVLPAAEKAQNAALAARYGVHGYPTMLLVAADGKELFRQGGYTPGGPAPFLKALAQASPPVEAASGAPPDAFAAFAAKGLDAPAPAGASTPSASP